MTGFLRFIGLLNAAVWFGAAVFFTLGVNHAFFSAEMKQLLGAKNYPYYSGAIAQVVAGPYYSLQYACGLVALLLVLAEWLYFGQTPRRLRFGLLLGLIALSLLGGGWVQPKLKRLTQEYARPQIAQSTEHAFGSWQATARLLDWLTVAGLAAYLWRVANPREATRFVSATKFRS